MSEVAKKRRLVSKKAYVILQDMGADVESAVPDKQAVLRALLNLRCTTIELLARKLLNYTPHDELKKDVVCATFVDADDEFDECNVVSVSVHHEGSEDGWSSTISLELCWFDDKVLNVTNAAGGSHSYENCTPEDVCHALVLPATFPIAQYVPFIVETLFMRINATLAAKRHHLAPDVESFLGMFANPHGK